MDLKSESAAIYVLVSESFNISKAMLGESTIHDEETDSYAHKLINLLLQILLHLSRIAFAQDWHFYIHLIAIEIGFVCFHLIKAAQKIQLYQYVHLHIIL